MGTGSICFLTVNHNSYGFEQGFILVQKIFFDKMALAIFLKSLQKFVLKRFIDFLFLHDSLQILINMFMC